MNLAEFLLARIADAEEVVRQYRQVWDEDESSIFHPYLIEKEDPYLCIDPAFVLAECEAKRRIVGEHPIVQSETRDDVQGCDLCGWDNFSWGPEMTHDGPCATLRLLALPYADHPDYRSEWRPEITCPYCGGPHDERTLCTDDLEEAPDL